MRKGLAFLCTVVAISCNNDEGLITDLEPGSIALSIFQSSVVAVQGTNRGVMAVITRSGSFTGDVYLVTDGLPQGVRSTVSNATTTRGVTTALISFIVGAATQPGVYAVEVRGMGTGVEDVVVPFTLTVTYTTATAATTTRILPQVAPIK